MSGHRTLPSDAPAHPEDSIERHWADAAAWGAFLDLLIFCGLGGIDFWLRYSLQRRANS